MANVIILYNSVWNTQVDLQTEYRAHQKELYEKEVCYLIDANPHHSWGSHDLPV